MLENAGKFGTPNDCVAAECVVAAHMVHILTPLSASAQVPGRRQDHAAYIRGHSGVLPSRRAQMASDVAVRIVCRMGRHLGVRYSSERFARVMRRAAATLRLSGCVKESWRLLQIHRATCAAFGLRPLQVWPRGEFACVFVVDRLVHAVGTGAGGRRAAVLASDSRFVVKQRPR